MSNAHEFKKKEWIDTLLTAFGTALVGGSSINLTVSNPSWLSIAAAAAGLFAFGLKYWLRQYAKD